MSKPHTHFIHPHIAGRTLCGQEDDVPTTGDHLAITCKICLKTWEKRL